MEFDLKRPKPTATNFSKTDLDIAYDYGKRAYKELGKLIRALVLFGSAGRHDKKHGDIDILVVLDDVQMQLSQEMLEAYRIISEKLVGQTSRKLHITTLKFTTFWDLVRNGDPVGINILREGHAIIDTGFFEPMQALLYLGKIKPTSEAVHAYYAKAPRALMSARAHLLQGVLDMYWAVIDSTQAAIMKVGIEPPNPKNAGKVVREELVKKRHLSRKYSKTVDKFYEIAKKIMHREVKDVSGAQYHYYMAEAQEYVDEIKKLIDKHRGVK